MTATEYPHTILSVEVVREEKCAPCKVSINGKRFENLLACTIHIPVEEDVAGYPYPTCEIKQALEMMETGSALPRLSQDREVSGKTHPQA